jgi:hypothetical protein
MGDDHPNALAYIWTVDAFRDRDFEAIASLIAEDVVWHLPGDHPLAGDWEGRDQLFQLLARLGPLGFTIREHDVFADDVPVDLLVALQDGADPGHVPEAAAATLSNYWEGIGTLARAGHLDRRLIWDNHGNTCKIWWGYLGPQCRATRARLEDPAICEHFEWLAGEAQSSAHRP